MNSNYSIEKIIKEMIEQDAILKDDNYMEWLSEVLSDNKKISTSYVLNDSDLSLTDCRNIENLKLFHRIVYNCVIKKIENVDLNDNLACIVRYKGKFYEVGVVLGSGTSYYAEKREVLNTINIVDYDEIKNTNVDSKKQLIK